MFFTPVIRRSSYVPRLRGLDAPLERWLDEALRAPSAGACVPHSVVTQDDKAYTVAFDVPGVSKAQLSIGIEGNVVRIESLPDAPRAYKLAYQLPEDIDVSASEAKLENGVLSLKLGKLVPAAKVTQLAID